MKKLLLVLEMIKFEHTVFALPFALLGAFLAARGFPSGATLLWILMAMVGARSAAMAFNRLADLRYDAANPRTAGRALPAGAVSRAFVTLFVIGAVALFVFSAAMLNRLSLILSPLALLIIFFYSYTKRFTMLSHIFLGLSLAIAPVGGWIAVTGRLAWEPFLVAAAVLFWVAGFDIIYACQDVDFDRQAGLHSVPSRLGIGGGLWLARSFHVIMVALLALAIGVFRLSWLSVVGLSVVIVSLIYEHSLVRVDDLSRVNVAFFTLNGIISLVLLFFVSLDLCLRA